MTRLLVILGLLAPPLARATDCSARLGAALERLMLVDPERDPEGVLARLDRDLHRWLVEQTRDFTPGRLENLLRVLEAPDYRAKIRLPAGFGTSPTADAIVVVALTEEGLVLRVGLYEITNELARAVMVHELRHLVRLTVEGDPSESSGRMVDLMSRRFGFYREEIHAFRASYRHYRRNYSAEDLDRLEQRPEDWTELEAQLLARGLLEYDAPHMHVHLHQVSNQAEAQLVRDLFAFAAKAYLHANVRDALSMSEPQWVKSRMGKDYRAFQASLPPRGWPRVRAWLSRRIDPRRRG